MTSVVPRLNLDKLYHYDWVDKNKDGDLKMIDLSQKVVSKRDKGNKVLKAQETIMKYKESNVSKGFGMGKLNKSVGCKK